MPTIKDVALACNVSIATASRALCNTGYVSAEKKNMILKAADELGYIVDTNAKTLKTGVSKTIGIIIPDIGNFWYSLVVKNLIVEFKKYDYKVLILYSFEDSETEGDNFAQLLSNNVDAIIFTPTSNKNRRFINIALKRKVPVLQVYRCAYEDVDSFEVNDAYGAYLATKELMQEGCKRILLLSAKVDFTPDRPKGYIQALSEGDIPVDENLIQLFRPDQSIIFEIKKLINECQPDGIIAGTGPFGQDTLSAFQEMGLSQDKIKVIIFDNLDWMKLLNITTIAQPIEDISTQVSKITISRIAEKNKLPADKALHIKINPELIIRHPGK
ncbi:MAG: LacI family transcriptional regulator [Bacilli bacterium]|jgi:LacI family transcriptional regulator|nr:LacI family transcriptional regulator [Bacilli bacterium]